MQISEMITARSFHDIAVDAQRRYSELRDRVASDLRNPTLPEDTVAILTSIDEQSINALGVLTAVVSGSHDDDFTISYAKQVIDLIDVLEDNIPLLLT